VTDRHGRTDRETQGHSYSTRASIASSPASEMTYTVSSGALNSTQTKPIHSVVACVKLHRRVDVLPFLRRRTARQSQTNHRYRRRMCLGHAADCRPDFLCGGMYSLAVALGRRSLSGMDYAHANLRRRTPAARRLPRRRFSAKSYTAPRGCVAGRQPASGSLLLVYGRRRRLAWTSARPAPPETRRLPSTGQRGSQWRRQVGEGEEASPLWVDVQRLCNMCVLSLSWNFFVSHDKYIARPSTKEPR